MSLLRYFSQTETGPGLPSPESTPELSSKEISTANRRVERQYQREGEPRAKRGEYTDWKESERAEIGRYASEHGVTKAIRYYERKLHRKMPETTVRRFRNLYRVTLKEKLCETYDGDVNVDFIPKKPRGRPTLLPSELDSGVQVYVRSLRHAGGIINTRIVVAAGKGIVEANNRSLLAENGGSLNLTQS